MFQSITPMRAFMAISVFATTCVPLYSQDEVEVIEVAPARPAQEVPSSGFKDATVLLGVRLVKDAKTQTEVLGRVLDMVFVNQTGQVTHFVVSSTGGRSTAIDASKLTWHETEKVFTSNLTTDELQAMPMFDPSRLESLVPAHLKKVDTTEASSKKDSDGADDEPEEKVQDEGAQDESKQDESNQDEDGKAKQKAKPLPILATLSTVMGYDIRTEDDAVVGRARKLILDLGQRRIAYIGIRVQDTVNYVPYSTAKPAWNDNRRVELRLEATREQIASTPQPSEENGLGIDDPQYRKCLDKYFAEAKSSK